MSAPAAKLDLRSGARVSWEPVHSGLRVQGKLVRPSTTNEEWLVKSDRGQLLWIHVTRLRPA